MTSTTGQLPMLAVVREAGQLRLIGQMTAREVHRLRTRDLRLFLQGGTSSTTSEGKQGPCDK
eukprot:503148-Pyramimonas_sp.AAC.1